VTDHCVHLTQHCDWPLCLSDWPLCPARCVFRPCPVSARTGWSKVVSFCVELTALTPSPTTDWAKPFSPDDLVSGWPSDPVTCWWPCESGGV